MVILSFNLFAGSVLNIGDCGSSSDSALWLGIVATKGLTCSACITLWTRVSRRNDTMSTGWTPYSSKYLNILSSNVRDDLDSSKLFEFGKNPSAIGMSKWPDLNFSKGSSGAPILSTSLLGWLLWLPLFSSVNETALQKEMLDTSNVSPAHYDSLASLFSKKLFYLPLLSLNHRGGPISRLDPVDSYFVGVESAANKSFPVCFSGKNSIVVFYSSCRNF